jgi:hypothetical protein
VELEVGVLLVDEHPLRMIDPAARTAKMMLPRLMLAVDGPRIAFSLVLKYLVERGGRLG